MSTAESAFNEFEPTLRPPSRAPFASLVTRAPLLAFALMVVSTCGRTATLMPAGASAFGYGEATIECNGIGFSNHTQVQGTLLTLNGLGLSTVSTFKIRLYVAALYVAEPSNDPHAILDSSAPNEIVIQFIRGVSARDLRKSLEEVLARNSPERSPAIEEGLQQLRSWAVDMKSGQRIVFIRTPGRGMEVDINGTVKGSIAGDDFAKSFLSIWLGDNPQTPELKRGLLGAPCV
jgi:Chalcone isomerase-like